MERCLASLIIKETNIKYYSIHMRMAQIRIKSVGAKIEKQNFKRLLET